MSKTGNIHSNSYGGGNLHTYDGKWVKPKQNLAELRKSRMLAQKQSAKAGTQAVTNGGITMLTPPQNLPAVIQKPQYNYNFQQMINQQAGIPDFRILPKSHGTPNLPVLFTGNTASNTGRSAQIVNHPVLSGGSQTGSASARIVNLPVVSRQAATRVNLPVVAERTASQRIPQLEVLGQTVNEVKKPGIWSSIKKGFKNIFSKAKTFFKSPKGKFSLVAAAVIAAGAAVWGYVSDRFSDKNKPTPTNGPSKVFMPMLENNEQDSKVSEVSEQTSEKKAVADEQKEEAQKTSEIKEEADKAAKANEEANKNIPVIGSGDEYDVVEGDCVWNIAKAHLKELHKDIENYEPSNADILNHTQELMKLNNLEYEKDNYVVIIQPGQKIKLK